MYRTDIGHNAIIIWRLLAEKQALTLNELKEYTKFDSRLILITLGWLLNENKISFFDSNGETKIELEQCVSEMYF